ncbi:MAG TPA: serine/threonine-protein kinase [Polyangia bacterium]|nr:serine/threonine-protein kinase [Polyangia bacterium]
MKLKKDTILGGRYNIRELLGEGGMGVVYRAVDQQLGREVALKTIQADKASSADFLKRFKREAIAISRIEHTHIVRLNEFVEASGKEPPYMVMELLSGKDMGSVIRKEGALDITRAVTRVLEASIAIAECHRHGYLHRDVKPNNIFLHNYNRVEVAKVLDFGAVKQDNDYEGQRDDTADLTRKGFILGTPYYMPPEQLAGRPATAKSDQYSLAIVLYHALAGRRPFDVKKPKEDFKDLDLAQAIRKGDYTPIQKVRPEVPGELADAIHKAMSVDPDKRFPDLHAFGAAIRPFASTQAKLTWELHFTNDAPERRAPQLSIAIMAKDAPASPATSLDGPAILDPTFTSVDVTRGTGTTVRARGSNETIALGTGELKEAAGEVNLATTNRQPAEGASRSLSLVIDEASQAVESLPSAPNAPQRTAETTSRRLARNKPAMIVLGALALLVAVLSVSYFLTHRKDVAPSLPQPPVDLTNPHLPAAAPTQPSPTLPPPPASAAPVQPPPAQPVAAPRPAKATPEARAPSSASDTVQNMTTPAASLSPTPKHHTHKKTAHRPVLDPNGIPIPTD